MGNDMIELRQQILSNARLMLSPLGRLEPNSVRPNTNLPTVASTTTLVHADEQTEAAGDIEAVIFGYGSEYTAAVMIGITPAIEGAPAKEPELALRRLLTATCELLNSYMLKLGAHQRNIHGGGVYDEDLIRPELKEAQRKYSTSISETRVKPDEPLRSVPPSTRLLRDE